MAYLTINNVQIKGISACVPKMCQENISLDVFVNEEEASKFISSTGIERRRVADNNTTTSDLCARAAEELISTLEWDKKDIECLIFVTQSPDYVLPATSCILQKRLALNEECYTLDISLGCSGWVYGLSVIASLMSSGNIKKGLLLVGDTISKLNSPKDKSTWPLFGDAGTATALEFSNNANSLYFHMATDGSGSEAIIIKDGGYRNQVTPQSFNYINIDNGIIRNSLQCSLNGMDVFAFGISQAPRSVNNVIDRFGINQEKVDYYLFHQANKFMNEKIRKKLKLSEEQVPYSLKNFGNTSSATIPLTMVTQLSEQLRTQTLNMIGCGFGVGLSWGTVHFLTDKICIPELIEI